ncbi:MMPL family transporter [Bordetella genomosp. 1]|uniref:MMPL family transporter n=1 Tax=Bordetella genomosp. 1 TaxID=1395607 RepID=UPI001595F3B1|nr:MMPL family transporter [Bordetella genomosp. 1]
MSGAPSPTERRLRRAAWLALALLLALLGWQSRHGWPVTADLMVLAPHTASDPVRALAQARVDAPLTRQMVVLVGHADRNRAVALAQGVEQSLVDSKRFDSVRLRLDVDLPALRQALLGARLAMLPAADRQLILNDPAAYATRRAGEMLDPFDGAGAVPLADDFLGLAARVERAIRPTGAVRLDLASATLQADADGRTWVLVLGQAHGAAFDGDASRAIAAALKQADGTVRAAGGTLLAAGGALYAAAGSQQAADESGRIGAVSLIGTVLVLLLALRRVGVLLAFFPVAVGFAAGMAACVALFGEVHVLTLVIGMSLLGIAIDFPLHWLGKSYGMADWHAHTAMRRVLPGLTISLAATLVGYVALAFTPFPALTQTAVFSAAGLAASYAATVLLLPALLPRLRPRPWPALARASARLLAGVARARRAPRPLRALALLLALGLCAAGILRLDMRDDLRQWLSVPPGLVAEARQIGAITGVMPTSQFFLVRAPDADTLLERQAALAARLDPLVAAARLQGYDALSQAAAPRAAQQRLQAQLRSQAEHPAAWRPLVALGVPESAIGAELRTLAALPPLGLDQVLASPLAERWRTLWLGRIGDEVAGLVTLQGLGSVDVLAPVAQGLPGVTLVDRSGELNAVFSATRLEAAELKAISYAIAAILIGLLLGRAAMWRILAVPVAATLATLAALGFAGQPVTLFSLFGLLLVSAMAVDYAVFMYEGVGGAPACLIGIGLGALTTLFSFGMLAASATPAIASFGLTVALGVLFSVFCAAWIRAPQAARSTPLPPRNLP